MTSEPKVCGLCNGTGITARTGLLAAVDALNATLPAHKRVPKADRRCVRCNGTKVEREILKPIDMKRVALRAEAFKKAGIMMPSVAAWSEAASEQYGDAFEVYDGKRTFPSTEIP